jgi:hypothetical protein
VLSIFLGDIPVRMTSKKPPSLIRMRAELKAAMEKAARDQNRSLSNLMETIASEWAEKNGYLPKPKEAKK